jgi:hypothetical protein
MINNTTEKDLEADLKDLAGRQAQNVNYLKDKKVMNKQELPDAYLHQRISFIKSAIRLGACGFGFFGMFEIGFIGLFLAEIVGIGEELV